jgi:hypothetical protein
MHSFTCFCKALIISLGFLYLPFLQSLIQFLIPLKTSSNLGLCRVRDGVAEGTMVAGSVGATLGAMVDSVGATVGASVDSVGVTTGTTVVSEGTIDAGARESGR